VPSQRKKNRFFKFNGGFFMKNGKNVLFGIAFGMLAAVLIMVGCSPKEENKGEGEVKLPDNIAAVTPEGDGVLTQGDNIQKTSLAEAKTFTDIVDNGFVDMYLEALRGMESSAVSRGTRAADESNRTYIGYGKIYGAVKVVHETGGDIETDKYAYESIANEFFDYSNRDSLYLGGSVSYFNTETRNQSGGINRTEQCDGTIRFNGKYKGEIIFDNVVCSRKIDNGVSGEPSKTGKFQLKSGTTVIDLPDSLIRKFCYAESDSTDEESKDTSGFVPVTSINCDIPTSVNTGEKIALLASAAPYDATNRIIVWSATGATVDSLGRVVTFGAVGTAKITATIANGKAQGQAYTQEWNVRVVGTDEFVAVDSIMFNIPKYLKPGAYISFNLYEAIVYPKSAPKAIQWSVTDGAELMKADKSDDTVGILFDSEIAEDKVLVVITATIADGIDAGTAYTQTWNVILTSDTPSDTACKNCNPGDFVAVANIEVNFPSPLKEGRSYTLAPDDIAIHPATATEQNIQWYVNGQMVTNHIVCEKAGWITVTAIIFGGADKGEDYMQSWSLNVLPYGEDDPCNDPNGNCKDPDDTTFAPVEYIRGDFPDELKVNVGDVIFLAQYNIKVYPDNATDQKINWSVSNATLEGDVITFNKEGSATITATVANGLGKGKPYTESWTVTVGNGEDKPCNDPNGNCGNDKFVPVERINAYTTAIAGETLPLPSPDDVYPYNATNTIVVCDLVSGPATINKNTNEITFTAAGTVKLLATIKNGLEQGKDYTQNIEIKVTVKGGGKADGEDKD
jgi:hypothetical protein